MPRRLSPVCLIVAALLAGGCSRPFFTEAPNPVEIDAREYARVYDAAIEVLRDYGFRVNREDARFGRITTYPLDSPTVVEPWRGDNTTAGQAWQSTLSHLRRTVRIFIDPRTQADAPDDGSQAIRPEAYSLRVEVLLENRQLPTRRLIPAQGRGMFSRLDAVPPRWRERGIGSSDWQPLGRDPYLEDRLARAIIERSMEVD